MTDSSGLGGSGTLLNGTESQFDRNTAKRGALANSDSDNSRHLAGSKENFGRDMGALTTEGHFSRDNSENGEIKRIGFSGEEEPPPISITRTSMNNLNNSEYSDNSADITARNQDVEVEVTFSGNGISLGKTTANFSRNNSEKPTEKPKRPRPSLKNVNLGNSSSLLPAVSREMSAMSTESHNVIDRETTKKSVGFNLSDPDVGMVGGTFFVSRGQSSLSHKGLHNELHSSHDDVEMAKAMSAMTTEGHFDREDHKSHGELDGYSSDESAVGIGAMRTMTTHANFSRNPVSKVLASSSDSLHMVRTVTAMTTEGHFSRDAIGQGDSKTTVSSMATDVLSFSFHYFVVKNSLIYL
eukprot:CAMPEP_0167745980 /NCGR_PEP_ID=MMETSP0110_2-20121227/3451_1 /TAXON_ID=629695 /ORGANISM="Gymnochlora sp., Strain CCMP2014" /LENGTH=353 /DNA_ID=CAMNT_0007630679 /DNA_START=288 /DNA_END=1349 /DNA_ORIENTATION=+